jgi:tetratricopeptide (TPR) repeat protein
MRTALALLVAVAALSATRPAFAQGEADSRAVKLFKESAELYKQGRFREAVDLLEEAHRLKPEPVLLYNLARAYEGLGDTTRALAAYQSYLAAEPGTPDKGAIETRIATLKRQLEERRALEARGEAAERDQPSPSPSPAEPRSPSPLPWIVAGVGAAGVGAGVVFGLLANSKHDDTANAESGLAATELQADAERFATIANVALVAGGVLCVGGVVWGVIDVAGSGGEARPASSRVSLFFTPTSARLRGSF